jgi:diaminopimelate decarboxylase
MIFEPFFPITTRVDADGRMRIAGQDLIHLASIWGTPLYVYDGATIRKQLQDLRSLLAANYPGEAVVAYAAKAYFSLRFAAHLASLGVGVDAASRGELIVARRAGFDPQRIHLHGNNKTREELELAVHMSIQAVVVDSFDELELLEGLAADEQTRVRVWLRITPGIDVNTHASVRTGHLASKFGFSLADGQASAAVRRVLASPWLELTGLHTHLGSQLFDPQPYRLAIRALYELAAEEHFVPRELSPGGGWGVRYTADDPSDDAHPWIEAVSQEIQEQCGRLSWPLPRLFLEPGRWIAARAGVVVYTVGTSKVLADGRRVVAVDGGMADNPRPALYGARYTACPVLHPDAEPEETVAIVGKFCENGDVLIPEIRLPKMKRDDLLAVPVSGAYQLSMASNYNLAPRPAVLWLEEEGAEILQERELPETSDWWIAAG